MIEQLGEVYEAGEVPIDVLVDLDELERACADLEQIIGDLDALSGQGGFANRLQLSLEFRTRDGVAAGAGIAQGLEFGQIRVELPVNERLLQ